MRRERPPVLALLLLWPCLSPIRCCRREGGQASGVGACPGFSVRPGDSSLFPSISFAFIPFTLIGFILLYYII